MIAILKLTGFGVATRPAPPEVPPTVRVTGIVSDPANVVTKMDPV